jgi:hypothetical protein
MLWLQGFQDAPPVVQACLRSWKLRNPTWRVVELTDANLSQYIDAESLTDLRALNVRPQLLSDLVRLYLLRDYGGVWVDATCFCCQPLDSWLHDSVPSGFFAFRNPGPDRILSSWFIAASQGNPLIVAVNSRLMRFLRSNRFPLQNTQEGGKRIKRARKILNRNAKLAVWWTSSLVVRIVKAYPYFIFHYVFARTVRDDKLARKIWEQTPFVSADGPHRMYKAGVLSPMSATLTEDLAQCRERMYKLTWKFPAESFVEGCILDRIIKSV